MARGGVDSLESGVRVQNAKDSFYEVLRERLASANVDRTMVVRGVTRPAVVVDENETQSIAGLPDCFHLRWTGEVMTMDGDLPMVSMSCEISYGTSGSAWNGGLDRGRILAALDGELLTMISTSPQNAAKQSFSGLAQGGAPALMRTRIWWSDPALGPVKVQDDRIARTATVQVMSYEEAGEA